MTKHLERDLDLLKRDLLTMGSMVEEGIHKATTALIHRRPELAEEVTANDEIIDQCEVTIEEECLKVLALHQPVATDLRLVVAVMKVNNDLERMGDLAANIAERALYLSKHDPIDAPPDFDRMVEVVREMARSSLDALVNTDVEVARRVCLQDDEVDNLNRSMFQRLQQQMQDEPATIPRAVHTLSASRYLERIADLATNIAEDVVFMVEGEVIRHRARLAAQPPKP